jgi:hypothetical protein
MLKSRPLPPARGPYAQAGSGHFHRSRQQTPLGSSTLDPHSTSMCAPSRKPNPLSHASQRALVHRREVGGADFVFRAAGWSRRHGPAFFTKIFAR